MPSAVVNRVLGMLPAAKAQRGGGFLARCPAHRDRTASLSVAEGTDGRALVRCFAGCTAPQVAAAMGLTMRELMADDTDVLPFSPDRAGHTAHLRVVGNTALEPAPVADRPAPRPTERPTTDPRKAWPVVATYTYTDAAGVPVLHVDRKEHPEGTGKTFQQRRPDGTFRGFDEGARPLYNLPAVREAIAGGDPVLLVEGEKDVATAATLGWTATTNIGGSNGWRADYPPQLAGADVVILPDHDAPGRQWAATAAESLSPLAKRVRIVALPRVPEKGDLTDWAATGGTADGLASLILNAPAWAVGDPIPEPPKPSRFRVYRADELQALPAPRWLVDGMLPADSLAAFVGPSGKGKTFATIDLSCSLAAPRPWLGHATGDTPQLVLYIAAEGTAGLRQRVQAWTMTYHTAPSLPVYFICETVNLLDPADVGNVLRAMTCLPSPPALVVVDTLHRSMPGGDENSAKDVGLVVTHADQIRRHAGCTVLIVHHTKKDADTERGSSALRAACDTLWLLKDEEGTRALVCEKQKDAIDFAPHALQFTPAYGSLVMDKATGSEHEALFPTSDPDHLTPNESAALRALAASGISAGLTTTEWKIATGIQERTFYRVRGALIRSHLVTDGSQRGARHTVTSTGMAALTLAHRDAHRSPDPPKRVISVTDTVTDKLLTLTDKTVSASPAFGVARGSLVDNSLTTPTAVRRVGVESYGQIAALPHAHEAAVSDNVSKSVSNPRGGYGVGGRSRSRGAPLPPAHVLEPRPYAEDEGP